MRGVTLGVAHSVGSAMSDGNSEKFVSKCESHKSLE